MAKCGDLLMKDERNTTIEIKFSKRQALSYLEDKDKDEETCIYLDRFTNAEII